MAPFSPYGKLFCPCCMHCYANSRHGRWLLFCSYVGRDFFYIECNMFHVWLLLLCNSGNGSSWEEWVREEGNLLHLLGMAIVIITLDVYAVSLLHGMTERGEKVPENFHHHHQHHYTSYCSCFLLHILQENRGRVQRETVKGNIWWPLMSVWFFLLLFAPTTFIYF